MIDLSFDYHAHILPGCDHGSDGPDTSLKQLEAARAAGVKTICATPHFYPHKESVARFLERRSEAYSLLSSQVTENMPRILLGAEVLICNGMEKLSDLRRLCLQGTNELLLEMPFYKWSDILWDTLFCLNETADIRLVIAHADRYSPADIQVLIDEGVPLQLNVECLTKPLRRKRYLAWIDSGYVRYLGSDIHMLGSNYQDWGKCRRLLAKKYK